jgi:hypothetical protein
MHMYAGASMRVLYVCVHQMHLKCAGILCYRVYGKRDLFYGKET